MDSSGDLVPVAMYPTPNKKSVDTPTIVQIKALDRYGNLAIGHNTQIGVVALSARGSDGVELLKKSQDCAMVAGICTVELDGRSRDSTIDVTISTSDGLQVIEDETDLFLIFFQALSYDCISYSHRLELYPRIFFLLNCSRVISTVI